MVRVTCRSCGADVRYSTKRCRVCGVRSPGSLLRASILEPSVLAFFILVVVLTLIWFW